MTVAKISSNASRPAAIGDKVLVRVATERTNDGTHMMNGRITKAYDVTQTVQAVYSDGSVRTCTGDAWNVIRKDDGLLAVR